MNLGVSFSQGVGVQSLWALLSWKTTHPINWWWEDRIVSGILLLFSFTTACGVVFSYILYLFCFFSSLLLFFSSSLLLIHPTGSAFIKGYRICNTTKTAHGICLCFFRVFFFQQTGMVLKLYDMSFRLFLPSSTSRRECSEPSGICICLHCAREGTADHAGGDSSICDCYVSYDLHWMSQRTTLMLLCRPMRDQPWLRPVVPKTKRTIEIKRKKE